MAQEAYAKITEQLIEAPANASANVTNIVAGSIKAKCGRFDVRYLTSRTQLLQEYTVDGKLSGDCDISLINVYELLGSYPLLLSRAHSKEYSPAKIESKNSDDEVLFSIVFNDFISDGKTKIKYLLEASEDTPGACHLNLKYGKEPEYSKYKLGENTYEGTSGFSEGDLVEIKSTSPAITLKARVFKVDNSGKITELRLLTSTGLPGGTEFKLYKSGATEESGSVTLTEDKSNEFDLIKEYDVIFSLDESVTAADGSSIFYVNVWKDEWPFHIEMGSAVPKQVIVPNPYVENDPTQPDTLTYLDYSPNEKLESQLDSTISGESGIVYDDVEGTANKSWSKFEVYEDRQIPVFSDFGTPNIGTYLKPLAEQFYGMYLISLPRTKESYAGATTWDDLDLGNSRRWAGTPFAQTTNLGFLAYIAPTTQYLLTLANNIAAGNDYEAVAGETTGVVSYTKLTKYYDKAEREKLLDLKINTITYKEANGQAFLNDDLTGLVMNNPFKEEFNRRMGITIALGIEQIMQQFKFKLNTPALRDTVTSTLNNYIDTLPFRTKFDTFEVICDGTNNPEYLQAQNKLAVTVNIAYYYSSKYIEILNKVYSVGQTFSE